MIKDWKSLTSNAKRVCIADFFWNLGRTLPHAILTVFLLYQGCSLPRIAFLQSIFMIVVMFTEFPSGVWADMFSRKKIYLLSLVTLLASYLLIGFFSTNYIVLCIAYALYGLSISLKSGTLDAEVVLELSNEGKSMKEYRIIESYVISLSSIIGGLCGSFLYSQLQNKIYFISLVLFVFAFMTASPCKFSKVEKESEAPLALKSELKEGYALIKESNILKYILLLFGIMTLFIQPFYQYWQVLYQENGISETYFGIAYVVFQVCGMVGTYIYKRISKKSFNSTLILVIIPLIYALGLLVPYGTIITITLAVILFNAYSMHVDIIQKENAPGNHISSFFSLVGTIENIFSIASLFIMAYLTEKVGVAYAYQTEFFLFSCIAIMVTFLLDKELKNKKWMNK